MIGGELYLNRENHSVQQYLKEHPNALKNKSKFEKNNKVDKEEMSRIISFQKYLEKHPDAFKDKYEIGKTMIEHYKIDKGLVDRVISFQDYLEKHPEVLKDESEMVKMIKKIYYKKEK